MASFEPLSSPFRHDGCGNLLADNNFAAWNACRVRGGKQVARAEITVGYCLIVRLKHCRGQGSGPLRTSSAHIPPPNGTVTRGWLLHPCRPEVLSRSRLQISTRAIFSLIMKNVEPLLKTYKCMSERVLGTAK
jgi:hypothetical protein